MMTDNQQAETRRLIPQKGKNMETIKELCIKYHIRQTDISKRFNIPIRTVQDWHSKRRTPPAYIIQMMDELLQQDKKKDKAPTF